ncbi:MAG: nucleotide exchange factor GrpE [Acutalibacteraceae bacterium]
MEETKKEQPIDQEVAENETETEEVKEVKEEKEESPLEKLEKELAAAKEAHIRTLAEYDNYRKRSTKEKEGIYNDAKAVCLTELLPIIDNFERALSVTESDLESYKKGTEMIFTSLMETFKKLGAEPFGEKGEEFDPNFHNGVMHVEDPELAENVIAEVFSKGYKLGDKVLRPAMVKVAN